MIDIKWLQILNKFLQLKAKIIQVNNNLYIIHHNNLYIKNNTSKNITEASDKFQKEQQSHQNRKKYKANTKTILNNYLTLDLTQFYHLLITKDKTIIQPFNLLNYTLRKNIHHINITTICHPLFQTKTWLEIQNKLKINIG